MKKDNAPTQILVLIAALASGFSHAETRNALSTAFTFQGQIKIAGVPVSGACDFEFTLWDDPAASQSANRVAGPLAMTAEAVNGLFTVQLDFGAAPFDGSDRWLEVVAQCPGSADPTTLTPRQPITATPYAQHVRGIFVNHAGHVSIGHSNPVSELDVSGTVTADAFVGNGSGLYNTSYWKRALGGSTVRYDEGAVEIGIDPPTLGRLRIGQRSTEAAIQIRREDGTEADARIAVDSAGYLHLGHSTTGSLNSGLRVRPDGSVRIGPNLIFGPLATFEVQNGGTTLKPDELTSSEDVIVSSEQATLAIVSETDTGLLHGSTLKLADTNRVTGEVNHWQITSENSQLSGDLTFRHNDAQMFTITPNGRVGILSPNPRTATALTVQGASNPTNSGWIQFRSASGEDQWHISGFGGDLRITESGVADRFVLQAGGNVGIGTSDPQARLHVNGDLIADGCNCFSDRRLKTAVRPIRSALDAVLRLRPVYFQWLPDHPASKARPDLQAGPERDPGRQIGFLAQELAELVPEVVSQTGNGYYTVDYGRITPVLAAAIQELRQEQQSKDAQIAAQSRRIAQLEARLRRFEPLLEAELRLLKTP